MRKKYVILGLGVILAFAGCGGQFPGMTDEQAQLIGEYAAVSLLKYDVNSRSRLVDPALLEPEESAEPPAETPDPQPEEPAEQEPEAPGTPVIEIEQGTPEAESIESFLELAEGVTIQYIGEKICQSYPEDEGNFFVLEAASGKQLLVLNFWISNGTGTAQKIDLLARRDSYRVTVNDNYTRAALTTMLTNDMSTFEGTIEAGESRAVVLLVEIDLQQTGAPESIVLNLKNDEKTYKKQLL